MMFFPKVLKIDKCPRKDTEDVYLFTKSVFQQILNYPSCEQILSAAREFECEGRHKKQLILKVMSTIKNVGESISRFSITKIRK